MFVKITGPYCESRGVGVIPADMINYFDIGMDSDVDIRTLPISE
jgi:hypothetical protein